MRLHVHEWGDRGAPPLVCLHGVTGHGRRFRRLAEERLARRFRVLAADLRGHGRSPWDPPWNIRTHLADVLDTFDAGPATWLGHSFGGRLVVEAAAAARERVQRAVLLDPALQVAPDDALAGAEAERAEKAFAAVDEAIAARLEAGSLYRTPREILEEEMREHLVESPDGRLRYRYCQSAVVTAWAEMASPPPRLAGVPTLLVVGAESDFVTEPQLEALRADLGHLLEVVTVPGGHMVYWDAFEETAAAIENFLGRD